MLFSSWLRNWKRSIQRQSTLSRIRRPRATARRQTTRLCLEVLEDRLAPAVLTVNSLSDNTSDTSVLTLRDAITLVNNAGNPASLGQSSMPAGWASQIDTSGGGFGVNDTIQFDAGLNGQTITLNDSALPDISQNVSIDGLGANNLAISCNNQSRVFTVDAGTQVSIADLTIEDGNAEDGGGILNNDGTLTVSNCTLSDNAATDDEGGIYNGPGYSVMVMSNCTLSGNSAGNNGGGIFGSAITVNNSSFMNNSAGGHGGGLVRGTDGTINNCIISDNSAEYGGGIDCGDASTINNCIISNNSAVYGGGIYNGGPSPATVSNSTIASNLASQFGGGIFNGSSMTVSACTIEDNTAAGGADALGGGGILTGCVREGTALAYQLFASRCGNP